MGDKKFNESVSRLFAILAIKEAQLMANPKPYIDEISRRYCELLDTLERIEHALSPDLVFDIWDKDFNKEVIQRPIDLQGEALLRCNAALEILRECRINHSG